MRKKISPVGRNDTKGRFCRSLKASSKFPKLFGKFLTNLLTRFANKKSDPQDHIAFLHFGFLSFEFVSNLDIRISDLLQGSDLHPFAQLRNTSGRNHLTRGET